METAALSKDLSVIVRNLARKKRVSPEEVICQAPTVFAWAEETVKDKPEQKLSVTSSDSDEIISDIELPEEAFRPHLPF